MKQLHIITPVKDSIELTLQTIESILSSDFTVPYHYYVYNDFSTDENTARLREASEKMGFELINLSDLTDHPSPNYLLILQTAQQKAIDADAGLLIVESDVIVKKHTLQSLFDGALARPDCGIAAAVTVDEQENINYPYLYAKGKEGKVFPEKKTFEFLLLPADPAFLEVFRFPSTGPGKELARCDDLASFSGKRLHKLPVYNVDRVASSARQPSLETT